MSRRVTTLTPIDPTPDVLTAEQLVMDGVCKKAEAMRLLGCGETRLKELVREAAFPSWKEGRDRVFPRAGLRAYLATRARQEGCRSRPDAPPTQPDPDVTCIWRAGAFSPKGAARFLSVSLPTLRRLAREAKWPRKKIRGTSRIVYPKALIREFLAACEDA